MCATLVQDIVNVIAQFELQNGVKPTVIELDSRGYEALKQEIQANGYYPLDEANPCINGVHISIKENTQCQN